MKYSLKDTAAAYASAEFYAEEMWGWMDSLAHYAADSCDAETMTKGFVELWEDEITPEAQQKITDTIREYGRELAEAEIGAEWDDVREKLFGELQQIAIYE